MDYKEKMAKLTKIVKIIDDAVTIDVSDDIITFTKHDNVFYKCSKTKDFTQIIYILSILLT